MIMKSGFNALNSQSRLISTVTSPAKEKTLLPKR